MFSAHSELLVFFSYLVHSYHMVCFFLAHSCRTGCFSITIHSSFLGFLWIAASLIITGFSSNTLAHSKLLVFFLLMIHSAIIGFLENYGSLRGRGFLQFSDRFFILDSSTILARSCLLVFLAIKAHFYTLDFF